MRTFSGVNVYIHYLNKILFTTKLLSNLTSKTSFLTKLIFYTIKYVYGNVVLCIPIYVFCIRSANENWHAVREMMLHHLFSCTLLNPLPYYKLLFELYKFFSKKYLLSLENAVHEGLCFILYLFTHIFLLRVLFFKELKVN